MYIKKCKNIYTDILSRHFPKVSKHPILYNPGHTFIQSNVKNYFLSSILELDIRISHGNLYTMKNHIPDCVCIP